MTATKIQPGDDTHLSLLMAPHSLNFVTGEDRAALLAYGRDVFAAARDSKCLAQIEEPAQPVAEICSASHDDAQFGERAIKPLCDISGLEYGTKLYAGAAPAAVAPHIERPYTLAEIRAKIATHDYNAELLLQHAMLLLEPAGVAGPALDVSAIAAAVCQRVVELPDRDSPADWPEAMLVTGQELIDVVTCELEQAQAAAVLEAPPGVTGRTVPRNDDERAAAQFFADNPSAALLAWPLYLSRDKSTVLEAIGPKLARIMGYREHYRLWGQAGSGPDALTEVHPSHWRAVADALDELAKLSALAPEATPAAPVAYLDIGAGGYMDLGTDLTEQQLGTLPKGRHMLAIIGTYGIDGYAAAPAATSAWAGPVRELLGHLSDVLDEPAFEKIDTTRWNAVSALVGAAEAAPAAPAVDASDTALLDAMERHRIALVPENEGPWDAELYEEGEEPQHIGSGATPREALRAAIAAQAKEGGA